MAISGNTEHKKKGVVRCNLFSCEKVFYTKADASSLRSSGLFNVCLVTSGAGMHQVLDQEIPCSKGDICIIPPNVPYDYFLSEKDGKLSVRIMEFDIADWFCQDIVTADSANYCYGIFNDNSIIAYATLNSFMQDRVYLLYDCIECELMEKKRGWEEMIRIHLTDLLISVSRYINSAIRNNFSISSKEWRIASASINAVQERYSEGITLKEIAESMYISQSRLSRIFKKTTGESFSQYLRNVRIKQVCELLKKSTLNVEDAAKACGFNDMGTFYEVFGEAVGVTPKKYRESVTPSKRIQSIKKINKNEEKIMVVLSDISENLQKGKAKIVKELVQQAINEGADPERILEEGLLAGMSIIGEKFKNNEVYVPEVLVAARAMNMGAEVLKPILVANGVKATGKVCIGTVQGDLHDIGKNLVKMMMEGKGLEVVDLGTDVAPETFVSTAIEQNCQVICCSALLTTTMNVMAEVVKAAEAAGIRDKVKIMIGGAPINEDFCKKIGADCYTVDAASAADAAVRFCKS